MKEIRTYMPFNFPVDPAKIETLPDMDLSYALASTLVRWDADKRITSGLATRWEITSEKIYKFTLPKDAKWSNGSPLTAQEVKRSFERGLGAHPEDLRSLANILDYIEAPSEHILNFHLKSSALDSNLLGKLTEPNYGILSSIDARSISLSVTSGPFYLNSGTKDELVLKRNAHWSQYSSALAEQVHC